MILLSLNGDNFSNDIYHAGVTADATFWLHDDMMYVMNV